MIQINFNRMNGKMNTQLAAEKLTELAHWLFTIQSIPIAEHVAVPRYTHQMKLRPNNSWTLIEMSVFIEWMQSAEGLEAVENAMIERGYNWEANYDRGPDGNEYGRPYYFTFTRKCVGSEAWSATKAEAILLAAYKAMKL
jgi:hypothetical protein